MRTKEQILADISELPPVKALEVFKALEQFEKEYWIERFKPAHAALKAWQDETKESRKGKLRRVLDEWWKLCPHRYKVEYETCFGWHCPACGKST